MNDALHVSSFRRDDMTAFVIKGKILVEHNREDNGTIAIAPSGLIKIGEYAYL